MQVILNKKAITKIHAIIIIAIIAVASAAIAGAYYFATIPSTKEIVIGAPLPLTGSLASDGNDMKQGFELAEHDINAAGGIQNLGGEKIKIVFEDTQSDTTTSLTETQYLLDNYNPAVMTGYYSTTDTLAAIPATERAQIPLLAPVAQGTALTTSGYQYVFCNAIQANKTGIVGIETLMAMAKQFGTPIHKIAVLGTDDPALLNDLNSTVAEANALGLQVVFYQTYPTGVKDVSNLVAELKAAQPDAVILLSFTAEAILAAQTLAEEKVDAITYFAPAGTGTMDPHFISTIGNESNYYIGGAGFMPDLNIPGLSDVVNRYETQYHEYMDEVAGQSYVSAWIIADVLELSAQLHPTDPLNGNSIRDAFLNVNITSGPATYNAAGHVQFNQDGENKYATLIYEQIQNGTQYTVWPLNLASKTAVWPLPKWESR